MQAESRPESLPGSWCVLDLETAATKQPSVCQIAVIFYDSQGNTTENYSSLVKPPDETRWNREFTEMHGITRARVKNAPSLPEVMEKLRPLLHDKYIVAYNSDFDYGCLEESKSSYYRMMWIPQREQFIDALRISRYTHPREQKHKLFHFVRRQGGTYNHQKAHDALYDCEVLGDAFAKWAFQHHGDISKAIVAHNSRSSFDGSYEYWQSHTPPSYRQASYVEHLMNEGWLSHGEVHSATSRLDYSNLIDEARERQRKGITADNSWEYGYPVSGQVARQSGGCMTLLSVALTVASAVSYLVEYYFEKILKARRRPGGSVVRS